MKAMLCNFSKLMRRNEGSFLLLGYNHSSLWWYWGRMLPNQSGMVENQSGFGALVLWECP